jgi:filamentous hemagglutinin family protein
MLYMATYLPWAVGLGLTIVSNRVRFHEIRKLKFCNYIPHARSVGFVPIAATSIVRHFCLVVGSAIAFSGNSAVAQITPDATLGTESSVITPNVNIRGLPADRIDGGAVRGINLFHSFQEFNVGDGLRVYFANPAGIENILSRITGSNLSNIRGTLGVDGGANLFLLNPNGIIFGQNARLDIAGSFFASTAESVVFNNGVKFSATNPQAPPLLTISITPGVQYGTSKPRATISNSGHLAVGSGQNLTLYGSTVTSTGSLTAPGGG